MPALRKGDLVEDWEEWERERTVMGKEIGWRGFVDAVEERIGNSTRWSCRAASTRHDVADGQAEDEGQEEGGNAVLRFLGQVVGSDRSGEWYRGYIKRSVERNRRLASSTVQQIRLLAASKLQVFEDALIVMAYLVFAQT